MGLTRSAAELVISPGLADSSFCPYWPADSRGPAPRLHVAEQARSNFERRTFDEDVSALPSIDPAPVSAGASAKTEVSLRRRAPGIR
jgi:hypothetical protein